MGLIERHPHFDLWLHGTKALEAILGDTIARRETIHDWPLSTVQRISCTRGKTVIYKIQRYGTVEPAFYKSAESSLLPRYEYLGKVNDCDAMVFEYIDAPRVADLDLDEHQLLDLGRRLQQGIRHIKGDLPVYTDIRDRRRWITFVDSTLTELSALIQNSVFPNIPMCRVDELRDWAKGSEVVRVINEESSFIHGDPNGDNIFVLGDDLKVIDWQRPRYAPRDVDIAGLLHGKGLNPYDHVQKEVAQIFWFLRVNWLTECKARLFPQGQSYEDLISKALDMLLGPTAERTTA